MAFAGGTIVNDVINFAELVVGHLKATLVSTEGLEIKDSATGEWYCVRITNAEWDKQIGTCASLNSEPPGDSETPPVEGTPPPEEPPQESPEEPQE